MFAKLGVVVAVVGDGMGLPGWALLLVFGVVVVVAGVGVCGCGCWYVVWEVSWSWSLVTWVLLPTLQTGVALLPKLGSWLWWLVTWRAVT